MGAISVLTSEYQEFLNSARLNRGAKKRKNFFDCKNVSKLKIALEAEIAEIKEDLQQRNNIETRASGSASKLLGTVRNAALDEAKKGFERLGATFESRPDESVNIDLKSINDLRKKLNEKESTPFLAFADQCIRAVTDYLNFVSSSEMTLRRDVEEFSGKCRDLYSSLLKALRTYRHSAKSHRYFKSSVGRAEIANKMTGGSLERWLNNSLTALQKTGTEFFINNDYKYVCRKATNDEESKHPDNKNRPKIFRFNHIIYEIVEKNKS